MKLYIMKRDALETLKQNLPDVYGNYYTQKSKQWIEEVCGENPFEEFRDVPEFSLTNLDAGLTPGEIDLQNCKILYKKLSFLSESQASDERLWAGLAHTTFYEYMRKRWGYGYGTKPKSSQKEAGSIRLRFFYASAGRGGFYRNTLSKCWWVGHNTYNSNNRENPFESLDIIGSNDLNSKITEFFRNYSFSSNPDVMAGIIAALREFRDEGKLLSVREHIRPAMSYLNAVGGSVVIDCLPKEEITNIFADAIDAILQGDEPSLNFAGGTEEDDAEEDDAFSEEKSERTDVALGCTVVIRNEKGEVKSYQYKLIDGNLPKISQIFTGHREGDTVEIEGNSWRIEEVKF